MTRNEARNSAKAGNKIAHKHFLPHEYLYEKNGILITEDHYAFEDTFWRNPNFKDGWSIWINQAK